MPQSGYTPIQIYASGVSGHIPSAGNLVNSALGAEIAINYADGKLFYKDNNGVVQQLTGGGGGGGVTTFSAGTTGFTPSTATSGTVTLGGILNVANGGTGQNNLTSGALLLGNGAGGVNALSGGTVGYVPTWNGTTWYSAPSGSGGVLSSNNTWTGINNFTNATTFSNTPTAGGYQVLTTSTGATLANNNLWTGSNSFTSNITANGFTVLTTNTGAGLGNNNSWTGTNAFSIAPTVSSYNVLTTNTGAQLTGATFSGDVIRQSTGAYSALQANSVTVGNNQSGMNYNAGALNLQVNNSTIVNITSSGLFSNGITVGQSLTNPVYIGSATGIGSGTYGGILSAAYNMGTYTSMYTSSGAVAISVSSTGSNTVLELTPNTIITGSNYWLYPASDGQSNLGQGSNRWNTVYATTGTINTSDATEKQQIADLTTAEMAVARRLKGLVKTFKYNDAVNKKGPDNARIHVGVLAQDVQAAFEAEGLDPSKYGVFCFDEWDDIPARYNQDGSENAPAIPAGSRLGVRYGELFAFIIAAL